MPKKEYIEVIYTGSSKLLHAGRSNKNPPYEFQPNMPTVVEDPKDIEYFRRKAKPESAWKIKGEGPKSAPEPEIARSLKKKIEKKLEKKPEPISDYNVDNTPKPKKSKKAKKPKAKKTKKRKRKR